MTRTRARKRQPKKPSQLPRLLRHLKPLVSNRGLHGHRVITTVSLSASERALLDEAARVHHISRATVLRTGLPLAVQQLTATTTHGDILEGS